MKLRKINKILKDPTTSKRLKKEIHYLFEKLEMVSFHRDILHNNKPVESTEELFKEPTKGVYGTLLRVFEEMKEELSRLNDDTSNDDTSNQPKGGEIAVLKAIQTIPGVITKGDLYYATSNDKYYFFSSDKGIPTHVLIEGMEYFELLPIKENKGL